MTISNSIVAGNSDDATAPDLWPGTGLLSLKHSIVEDNSGTRLAEAPVGLPDTDGNLIGDPTNGAIDPLLGPLTNNGGPTFTHPLLAGSPAIDVGDVAFTPPPDYDQRGAPYTRGSGGRIDIGAHEKQSLSVEILDVASPAVTPVEEVTVRFTSAISGFDLDDLNLSANDRANLLSDSQTLTTTDNQTFVLGGLSDVTRTGGYYTLNLTVSGTGIVDENGDPLDSGDSVSWSMGRSELGLTVNTLLDEADGLIDDGDISLRDAISAAAPGETIDFEPALNGSTILLRLGELFIARSVSIDATALAEGWTIDASGNDPTPAIHRADGSRFF